MAAFARHFAKEGYDLIVTGLPDDKVPLYLEGLKAKFDVNVEKLYAEFGNENGSSRKVGGDFDLN